MVGVGPRERKRKKTKRGSRIGYGEVFGGEGKPRGSGEIDDDDEDGLLIYAVIITARIIVEGKKRCGEYAGPGYRLDWRPILCIYPFCQRSYPTCVPYIYTSECSQFMVMIRVADASHLPTTCCHGAVVQQTGVSVQVLPACCLACHSECVYVLWFPIFTSSDHHQIPHLPASRPLSLLLLAKQSFPLFCCRCCYLLFSSLPLFIDIFRLIQFEVEQGTVPASH